MSDFVVVFRSRAPLVLVGLALGAFLGAGCGGESGPSTVSVGGGDGDGDGDSGMAMEDGPRCDDVEIDGEFVIEHEERFTARYRIGERYTKTVLLFGGEAIEKVDTLANAYVLGLDKEDALALAETFPDFYLCSSPGGDAAAERVFPYDFVPANCEVLEKLVTALEQFAINHRAGADRTSIRFEGAPLELLSVVDDASGVDVTDQVKTDSFHLITSVEQLTGQSVLEFGTTE
jgi:hypothetical protein